MWGDKRASEEGVYQVPDWATVRELIPEGVPKKRIAEQLGCSRTPVYSVAGPQSLLDTSVAAWARSSAAS